MPVLKSSLDVAGPRFAANKAAMEGLLDELREHTSKAALGGAEASRQARTGPGLHAVDATPRRATPAAHF